jgi:predicted nucleic acid-binding protein
LIVVDASAALAALLGDGPARRALAEEHLHAPHLIDVEVASGLRRLAAAGRLQAADGSRALEALRALGMRRHAMRSLLQRIWELRDNLSAYDAAYVALAEELGCGLLTADARLAGAAGVRCPVNVVPG